MKRLLFLIILLVPYGVYAEEKGITASCQITVSGQKYNTLTDDDYLTYNKFTKNDKVHISCEEDIHNVYIYYDVKSTEGNLTYPNVSQSIGQNHYLHELINLESPTKELDISYNDDFTIADIYLFANNIPSWVENWQRLKEADMMLFTTHADDEQLFFAGLLPTYVDRGKKIQVVYFTNHFDQTRRYHELLEGLWALGIKYYPEESLFPDAWSDNLSWAITNLNSAGYTEEDALSYEVKMLRKYKPQVVVGHDENGEYSHGQHILNTYILKDAIIKAGESSYDGGSLLDYGPHQIDKLYLHLYHENKIVMDYDIPLDSFDGKTAYEVAKIGFSKHYSQAYTWFTAWLNGVNNEYTKATEIDSYIPNIYKGPFTPCNYGLYYTNVGEDINKNDMFENIIVRTKTPSDDNKINIDNDPNSAPKYLNKKYLICGSILIILSILGFTIILKKKK